MLAHAPHPELARSYLARGLARLYVTARDTEPFDQYKGISDESLTEHIARALFAANRQGRAVKPPTLLHPMRQHEGLVHHRFRAYLTETILGVDVTTTADPMAVLRVLAEQSPQPLNMWALAKATGQDRWIIPNRINFLRRLMQGNYPTLRIPPVTRANAGWCLERAS